MRKTTIACDQNSPVPFISSSLRFCSNSTAAKVPGNGGIEYICGKAGNCLEVACPESIEVPPLDDLQEERGPLQKVHPFIPAPIKGNERPEPVL